MTLHYGLHDFLMPSAPSHPPALLARLAHAGRLQLVRRLRRVVALAPPLHACPQLVARLPTHISVPQHEINHSQY